MTRKSTIKTPITVQTYETLNSLTRNQLRALAARAGVKMGRNKKDSVANLSRAISDGKLLYKSEVSIFTPPTVPGNYWTRTRLFAKKFRSYKPDRVLFDVTRP
jgi:hypothetical protein